MPVSLDERGTRCAMLKFGWPTGLRHLTMLTCAPLLIGSSNPPAEIVTKPPDMENFGSLVDELVPELMEEAGIPGAVIALNRGGHTLWIKSFGYADVSRREPVTPDTIFNVGSISKSVAAVGIMKLVEAGQWSLDTPYTYYVQDWRIPAAEGRDAGVTVRAMLSHTAGLSLPGYPGWSSLKDVPSLEQSLNGKVNRLGEVKLIAPPGQHWIYSGAGFTVLQMGVEKSQKRSFERYMSESLFEPLGLRRTSFANQLRPPLRRATPYDALSRPIPMRYFAESAAAGLSTSARDLAKLASLLAPPPGIPAGGGVVTPATVQRMLTPVLRDEDDPGRGTGLGFYLVTLKNGVATGGHSGRNIGWVARYRFSPSTGDALIILTNSDVGSGVLAPLTCEWEKRLGEDGSRHCPRSAVPPLARAFLAGGAPKAIAAFTELQSRGGTDLNAGTLSQIANMFIHEAPLDAVRPATVTQMVALLEFNRRQYPGSAAAARALAEGYFRAARMSDAIRQAEEAVAIAPGDIANLVALAEIRRAMPREDATPK